MITQIFSIYDKKAAAYLTPFFMRTKVEAMRAVAASVQADSNFARYPEDFRLVALGAFNDVTGVFSVSAEEDNGECEVVAEVADIVRTMVNGEREQADA